MRPSSIYVLAATLEPAPLDLGEFSSPDGALTLLFTDLAEGGTIRETLGDERWRDLLRDRQAILEPVVAAHDGSVVRHREDGLLIVFGSAHAGVRCAIELQRAFDGRPLAGLERPVAVRAGVHSGFVIVSADDYLGRNVVLAARIADRARGGEILASSALKQYTETDPGLRFEPRGDVHFKGLLGEHAIFAVGWRPDGPAAAGSAR